MLAGRSRRTREAEDPKGGLSGTRYTDGSMALRRSRSLMARLLGSPTGAAAIADTHVFLQQRVTLFAKILFSFFAAFLFFGCLKSLDAK